MIGQVILGLGLAYLLGSIPSGYLFGILFGGKSPAEVGSSNVGAANTFRNVSPVAGILTLAADVGKGYLAVKVALALNSAPLLSLGAALLAVLGHNFMLFLRFKGGKGVATSLGALLGIAPPLALVLLVIAGLLLLVVRDSNIAMALALGTMPVVLGLYYSSWPAGLVGLAWAAGTIVKYRPDCAAYKNGRRQIL